MAFQLKNAILKATELVSSADASIIESSRFPVLLPFYYYVLLQI